MFTSVGRQNRRAALISRIFGHRFEDADVEAQWQIHRFAELIRATRGAVVTCASLFAVFFLMDLAFIHSPPLILVVRILTILGCGGFWLAVRKAHTSKAVDRLVIAAAATAMVMIWPVIFWHLPAQDVSDYWLPGGVLMIGGMFTLFEAPLWSRIVLGAIAVGVGMWTAIALEVSFREQVIGVVHLGGMFAIGWTGAWQSEKGRRLAFSEHLLVQAEQTRADTLLRNILPESIAGLLMTQPGAIARRHASVTVLFADLVGFTPMSAKLPAEDVVDRLDSIFTRFDRLCEKHEVEKIKTIGDAYMVAAGVPDSQADHASRVAAFALDMLDVVREEAQRFDADLELRIGLNSGPVVAGVIGERKFVYDLWGDTVNVASRMESHGLAGRVQVSDTTAAHLTEGFKLTERGQIDVKGRGMMTTFLVDRAAPLGG